MKKSYIILISIGVVGAVLASVFVERNPGGGASNNAPAASPGTSVATVLAECQPGCIEDSQCENDLVCWKDMLMQKVPGCDSDAVDEWLMKRSQEASEGKSASFCVKASALSQNSMDSPLEDATEARASADDSSAPSPVPSGAPSTVPTVAPSSPPSIAPTQTPLNIQETWDPVVGLRECRGNCQSDYDCEYRLVCSSSFVSTFQAHAIPGCEGVPLDNTNYCHQPYPNQVVLIEDPPVGSPLSQLLGECEGECDTDDDCLSGLRCFQRDQWEAVPGCVGSGIRAYDYCYRPVPTAAPTRRPIDDSGPITYKPGKATVMENGLLLSEGLTHRVIATSGMPVRYDHQAASFSEENFHFAPDGAAVFANPDTNGWTYVSNAELGSKQGGVGAIDFDVEGNVVGYRRLLSNTTRNCGGGKTFWNTWLTCEETDRGQVWEVDPWGKQAPRQTVLGGPNGAWYESAAYDNRNPSQPTFYVTIDEESGPLVRFIPNAASVQAARTTGDYSQLLHSQGRRDFMVVNNRTKTFEWVTDYAIAKESASQYYKNSEGIDIRDGRLYMTTKRDKLLFILDLDAKEYSVSSTRSGAFNDQPDQIARILGDEDGVVYFCEDGGRRAGIHGRNSQGRFFTILEARGDEWNGETTGIAFSPDNIYMYVSYQWAGKIIEVRRTDGRPFGGQRLDIKYHADDTNQDSF